MLGCSTRAHLGDATHPRASLSHPCTSQGATWRCHRRVPLATGSSCCSFRWDGAREHAPEQGKVAENNRRCGNRWQQRPASCCRPLSVGQTPCTEMILRGDALPASMSQPLPIGTGGLGWGGRVVVIPMGGSPLLQGDPGAGARGKNHAGGKVEVVGERCAPRPSPCKCTLRGGDTQRDGDTGSGGSAGGDVTRRSAAWFIELLFFQNRYFLTGGGVSGWGWGSRGRAGGQQGSPVRTPGWAPAGAAALRGGSAGLRRRAAGRGAAPRVPPGSPGFPAP